MESVERIIDIKQLTKSYGKVRNQIAYYNGDTSPKILLPLGSQNGVLDLLVTSRMQSGAQMTSSFQVTVVMATNTKGDLIGVYGMLTCNSMDECSSYVKHKLTNNNGSRMLLCH